VAVLARRAPGLRCRFRALRQTSTNFSTTCSAASVVKAGRCVPFFMVRRRLRLLRRLSRRRDPLCFGGARGRTSRGQPGCRKPRSTSASPRPFNGCEPCSGALNEERLQVRVTCGGEKTGRAAALKAKGKPPARHRPPWWISTSICGWKTIRSGSLDGDCSCRGELAAEALNELRPRRRGARRHP